MNARAEVARHQPQLPDMNPAQLEQLAQQVRAARGVQHKSDIADVVRRLAAGVSDASDASDALAMGEQVLIGDDCAAIPDGDGYLLFAIEGFVKDFVQAEPFFAGYCGVMVNVSDIYAMGGRPLAVVNALWSRSAAASHPLIDGMAHAARVYGVPVVGGHSNQRCADEQLAVAILGRATALLTSFAARPGEHLVAAIDLRGHFHAPFPYWDASSDAPAARLRGDLDILPMLAEQGLCRAAKDISMAGIIGTALMFAECSGVGACIDVNAIPRPHGQPLSPWIDIFPSYGFLLSVDDAALPAVLAAFAARDITAASIGRFDSSRQVRLAAGNASTGKAGDASAGKAGTADTALVWDFNQEALIACGPGMAAGAAQ